MAAAHAEAPRKQRHTAKRVWQRLVVEHGAQVAETTVRDYVRRRRHELGEPGQAFVPQVHRPGREAEVDWGEAKIVLAAEPATINLFVARLCHSGAAFVCAFAHARHVAFLEGHV